MAGTPENPSKFVQDITQRSAGRHGSTCSRPDIWGDQHSPFQGSAASVNCESDNTFTGFPNDLDENEMGDFWDYDHIKKIFGDFDEEKPEDNDQKLQIGMMFPSLVEAEEYYRNHAKKTGFTVRKGKIQKLPDGALKWRRLLCSCQGHRAKKQSNEGTKYQRLDTRTGCQAHIQFTLENGQYMITHLQLEHNHNLKISDGITDKSNKEALTGPSEELEGASVDDKVCSKHPLKQIRPQVVESGRANGEQLQMKNKSSLPQQTQEDSVSSYSEESIPKASDEVETACNYMQLTMEERSLPTPTLPITTNITSARTPAAGCSSPSRNSLQELSHSHRSESIWQQILTKYGDITAKCGLTSPVFVAFVKQSILKIVELLQNNTARGLSREKLSTIRCMLGDLELVHVEIGWLRTRYVAAEDLIDYAKAKNNRDLILRRFLAKRAEVAALQVELDQAEARLHELQQRVPDWLSAEDTLGKGLL